ncbi:BglG family transcription antiterminator [Virgibacillus phasianinus]|nr:BglG family transcription antiterminator [Virgibacillus phasianinus]
MNSRWKEIIQILKTATEPMTSSQLSIDLQVSSKTVRNDIKELNLLLHKNNMQIESHRGKGYKLEIKDENRFNQFLQQYIQEVRKIIPDEPTERVTFLVERLLLESNYVKMEDLADELYVSRSTLQSDLKSVRYIFKLYDLSLDQRPNYGIKIIGNEAQIRFCISEYIFNQRPISIAENSDWISILSKNELNIIRNSILTQLRKHNIIISDISLQNLITHLAIACKRIRDNNQVEIAIEELDEIKENKEFAVAKEIMRDIESGLSVCFSVNEVFYLAIHLQGTKLINSDTEKERIKSVIDQEIVNLVKEMIKRIDEKYHFNLSGDDELLLHLSLHLKPAISRYKYQMNIRNPMLSEIKKQYPASFEAALIGIEVLNEKYNIFVNEHEIAYISLHIEAAQERLRKSTANINRCLIVCASGLGSAQLLSYKLKAKFEDTLDIIGTTEYYNLSNFPLNNISFVITTVPIKIDLPVPVIHIGTILGDNDVNKINRIISTDKSIIDQYLHERFTFLNQDFETPDQVIKFLGNKLIKAGTAGDDYIDSVMERERYSPTSFGNLVAIPHPLEPKTDFTFWSIVTLNNPIQWGEKLVQVVFLLNVNKAKENDLKAMFRSLVKLVDNRNLVHQLLDCKSYQQFLDRIGKL